MVHSIVVATAALLLFVISTVEAFTSPLNSVCKSRSISTSRSVQRDDSISKDDTLITTTNCNSNRRVFLTNIAAGTTASSAVILSNTLPAFADEDSFAEIAARAAKVSKEVTEAEAAKEAADAAAAERRNEAVQKLKDDKRTIYDFTLPINGKAREVAEILDQTFDSGEGGDGWSDGGEEVTDYGTTLGTRVKAILVVNIKQDDPIARKNIPELIALVSKFNKNGEFAVIMSPTDQGYYEPDTSSLLRLKVEQEYGYGSAMGEVLTDKVNLLGSGALPFWRWLEGNCRTPAGLGKIQANFEKFLIDGRTGKPLRRYPRKYQPYDIADDIAALIKGKPLPPAGSNFKEEWRNAAKEAENDTYRFQKGLNYFDQ